VINREEIGINQFDKIIKKMAWQPICGLFAAFTCMPVISGY